MIGAFAVADDEIARRRAARGAASASRRHRRALRQRRAASRSARARAPCDRRCRTAPTARTPGERQRRLLQIEDVADVPQAHARGDSRRPAASSAGSVTRASYSPASRGSVSDYVVGVAREDATVPSAARTPMPTVIPDRASRQHEPDAEAERVGVRAASRRARRARRSPRLRGSAARPCAVAATYRGGASPPRYCATVARTWPDAFRRPRSSSSADVASRCTAAMLWLTNSTVRPPLRDVVHLAEALLLEARVADRQHLVDDQDLGLEVRGDGEREPHVHAARVVLHRRVDEPLDLRERDDLVELARRSRAASCRGSRRSGRCSRGR